MKGNKTLFYSRNFFSHHASQREIQNYSTENIVAIDSHKIVAIDIRKRCAFERDAHSREVTKLQVKNSPKKNRTR